MNPCGSIIDIRTSLDVERMQLSDDPEDISWGRWEWCQEGALPMPFFHAFASPTWETDREYFQEGAGFSIERPKARRRGEPFVPVPIGMEQNEYRPNRTSPFPGQGFRGTIAQWQDGLEPGGAVEGDQAPLCGGTSWDSRWSVGLAVAFPVAREAFVDLVFDHDDPLGSEVPFDLVAESGGSEVPFDLVAESLYSVGPGSGGFVFTTTCPLPGVPRHLRLTYGNDWSDMPEVILVYSDGTNQWNGSVSGPHGAYTLTFYDVGGSYRLEHSPGIADEQQLPENWHDCEPFQWQSLFVPIVEGGSPSIVSASIVPGP